MARSHAWQDHRVTDDEPRRWPCCLTCTPRCTAGCGDEARVVKLAGMLVGAFCRACYAELAHGKVPHFSPTVPRRPRGPSLRDLQNAHR